MLEKQIPPQQNAWVATEAGHVELQSIDVPVPQSNEALVKLEYTGVCHSDVHLIASHWPLQMTFPTVCGHEGVGVVVALGTAVTHLNIGDRVGIKWLNSACGRCEYCLQSYEAHCSNAKFTGFSLNGTFQEYAIGDAEYVTQIPGNVSSAAATAILCAGVTVYRGIKEGNPRAGRWIAILGAAGGLGHLAVQYAKACGLQVLAIDTGEAAEKLCKSLGAEEFVDYKASTDVAADVKTITKGGAHIVLVAASGNAYTQAVHFLRPKGVLVALGLPPNTKIESDLFWHVLNGYTIKGSLTGNRKDTDEALDFVARGIVKVSYTTLPFSSLPKVLDDLKESKIVGRVVLDISK